MECKRQSGSKGQELELLECREKNAMDGNKIKLVLAGVIKKKMPDVHEDSFLLRPNFVAD